MTELQAKTYSNIPFKSVAIALIFSSLLGPIGLLYSSVLGGTIMILICWVVFNSKLVNVIALAWAICSIWAVIATNRYNRKILKHLIHN